MIVAAAIFITLHGPAGQEIYVNPRLILSARAPRETQTEHFAAGVQCVLEMNDGKLIAVTDPCSAVTEYERPNP